MKRLWWAVILIPLLFGAVAGGIASLSMSGSFTVLSTGLSCSPCSGPLAFGNVIAGGPPVTATFTLTNTGATGTPVLTLAYTVTPPTGITLTLTVAGTSLNGATLAPGASVTVTATLTAASTATAGAGTLTWSITGS